MQARLLFLLPNFAVLYPKRPLMGIRTEASYSCTLLQPLQSYGPTDSQVWIVSRAWQSHSSLNGLSEP